MPMVATFRDYFSLPPLEYLTPSEEHTLEETLTTCLIGQGPTLPSVSEEA